MILVKPSVTIEQLPPPETGLYQFIERIGRVCYKSEHKIMPGSEHEFVSKIMKNGHHSVIEHCVATFSITCARNISHEIVRHRLASYTQESTRYCNYGKNGHIEIVRPHWMSFNIGIYSSLERMIRGADGRTKAFMIGMWSAERSYFSLLKNGVKPQDARAVLPTQLKTELFMTANLREWRHILELRTSPAAHPDIRIIMNMINGILSKEYPVIFNVAEKEKEQ